EASLPKAVDGIGRWYLDPVHLARAQCGQTGVCLGHREQHDLVELGDAGFVPVARIFDEIDTDARLEVLHLEGPGADGRLRKLGPVARLLEGCRTYIKEGGEHVGEVGDWTRRDELDSGVIDLAITILGDVGGTTAVD